MITLAYTFESAATSAISIIAASPYFDLSSDEIAFFLMYSLISFCVSLAFYVVTAFFTMQLFAKANVPAWKAWVPFVNTWKLFELGGYQGVLSLLWLCSFIPCIGWIGGFIGIVISYMAAYQIGLKNNKDGVWVVLFIFLPIVWYGILGLGSSVWNDSLGKPAYGPERPPSWPYNESMPTSGSYYGSGYNGSNTPPPPPPSNY